MTRIKGANVQIGGNFVLPLEKQEAPEMIKLKTKLNSLADEIRKVELQKEEIIKSGQRQADELVNEAKLKIEAENNEIAKKREEEKKAFDENMAQEAERIKTEAYQTGYDDGYKQGYVVTVNELENKIHAVDTFTKCQFEIKNNIIKSSELDIISLVVEIAKKVCTKSLELNPEIIKLLTVNAIKELKDKEEITIIINPKLMEVINSISDSLKDDIPQLQSIKILEDKNVSPDGTIVESPLSRVDCRVKSQINEIADKLFETYNSEDEEFEKFMMSLTEPDISSFENIELSDDANIESFLEELEDISSYEDKIRDEDAFYYDNLDLEELRKEDIAKNEEENTEQAIEPQIENNDINWDEIEDMLSENPSGEDVIEQNNQDVDIYDIVKNIDLSAKDTEKDIVPDEKNLTEIKDDEAHKEYPNEENLKGEDNV